MVHENGSPAEVAQYGRDRLAVRGPAQPIVEDGASKGQVGNEIEWQQLVGNVQATLPAEHRRSHISAGMSDQGGLEQPRQTGDGEGDRPKPWTRDFTEEPADRRPAPRQETAQPILVAPIHLEHRIRETQRESTPLGMEPPHRSQVARQESPIRPRAEVVLRPTHRGAAHEAIRPRTETSLETGRRQQPKVEPPTVTVSIGTIEIRTSGKPDSPPARQRGGSRVMTLDEYLAKRERA
jgi:hypothetical protein